LKELKAGFPTIKGNITVEYTVNEAGEIEGKIVLPEGVSGHFQRKNSHTELKPGINIL